MLHILRVRGFVTPDGFRGEPRRPTRPTLLTELVAAGQVRHIEKRDMYGLLPPGKERQEALIDTYAGATSVRPGSRAHYERFLELERGVQAAVHRLADARRRAERPRRRRVRRRMRRTARGAQRRQPGRDRRLRDGAAADGPLPPRLDDAAARVAAGDTKAFTGVMCARSTTSGWSCTRT